MKFYIRQLPQKQYHQPSYCIYGFPLKDKDIRPGDIWCTIWEDYHIDKVEYSKNSLKVYATMTQLSKARKSCYYKKKKNVKVDNKK